MRGDRGAVGKTLHPLDHDLLSGAEPRADAIAAIRQFAQLHRLDARVAVRVERPDLRLPAHAHHRLLRHRQRVGVARMRHPRAHEHAREQLPLRIVHQYAQQDVSGAGVDVDAGEQDVPLGLIRLAVAAQHRHRQAVAGARLLRRQRLPQGLERGRRTAHVDVDLVDLLDACHRVAVAAADQRPLGDQRLVDATRDRGLHRGELQVELSPRQRGAGLLHIGGGLVALRHRVVVGLPADRIGLDQGLEPCRLHPCARQRSLGPPQGGGGRVRIGPEGGRVDLEQRLAGAHLGALLEQPALHDAADLRPDLGNAHRCHAAGQVFSQFQVGRRHGGGGNLGRGRGALRFGWPATRQHRRQQDMHAAMAAQSLDLHMDSFRRRQPAAGKDSWQSECARWCFG